MPVLPRAAAMSRAGVATLDEARSRNGAFGSMPRKVAVRIWSGLSESEKDRVATGATVADVLRTRVATGTPPDALTDSGAWG